MQEGAFAKDNLSFSAEVLQPPLAEHDSVSSGCLALIQIEAGPGKTIARFRSNSRICERQPHLKPGITRFRIDMNAAAVLLHNPLDGI